LAQPHNTYLELAAMAGLPVLLLFLILLGKQVRPLLATYGSASTHAKPLVGGTIAAVAVLAINSLTIPGWTVEPLACLGWLLLGALSSPCLSATGMGVRPAFARLGRASLLAGLAGVGARARAKTKAYAGRAQT